MTATTFANICHRRSELIAAGTPHCKASDIGINFKEGFEDDSEAREIVDDINKYLQDFASPSRRGEANETSFLFGAFNCICCDKPLTGMLGSFQWGIANGEGNCSGCGWPTRMYHDIKDRHGKPLFDGTVTMPLQYHPENVQTAEERELALEHERTVA